MTDQTAEAARLDPLARAAFAIALRDGRAGELLLCLFNGGTCTVDAAGVLVMIPGSAFGRIGGATDTPDERVERRAALDELAAESHRLGLKY